MIKCHFREADPISKDEYNKTIEHRCKSLDGHNKNLVTYSANNLSPETESSLTFKFSERIQKLFTKLWAAVNRFYIPPQVRQYY